MGSLSNNHKSNGDTNTKERVVVIMVPFPAQSHLNQLIQLSCLIISSYGLPVHYVGSTIHNRQAKSRVNGLKLTDVAKIHFHDIPTPPFASPPTNPNSHNKFPSQLQPAWYASLNLREPIATYLREMSNKVERLVIIHDAMMAVVVQDFRSIPNAESYAFNPISAFSQVTLNWEALGKPFPIQLPKELPSLEDCITDEVSYLVALQSEPLKYKAGVLYNTCRQIEGPYLELLASKEIAGNSKTWAIGPILPTELSSERKHKCLEWLDKHDPNSVIYVSFGTTTSLSDEQIKEIAFGLEKSKVKFLWVLRDADKADVFDEEVRKGELPEGFEERIEGLGMVVRDWAPQPDILTHPSTGGFMSHCGWNSCLESITMGVPIAAWPMHSEQPRNTSLIIDILKLGIIVKEWTQRGGLVKSSTVENAVRRLMVSEEGNEIRKRADVLGATVRGATEKGGASRLELDSFVHHINRPNDLA